MNPQKFRAGQKVSVLRARSEMPVSGRFEIVRPMPQIEGQHQYRIRSLSDGRERVAGERELELAA